MESVKRQVDEIKRLQQIVNKSKSRFIKNDYTKRIIRLKNELKDYCDYRGYDYKKVRKQWIESKNN